MAFWHNELVFPEYLVSSLDGFRMDQGRYDLEYIINIVVSWNGLFSYATQLQFMRLKSCPAIDPLPPAVRKLLLTKIDNTYITVEILGICEWLKQRQCMFYVTR